MYLALLTITAIGCIVAGLIGGKVGVKGSNVINSICVVLSVLLSLVDF